MAKYLQNVGWLFLERGIYLAVNFFVWAWMAQQLGPERFGLLNYAQSFALLFVAVSTLGLDNIVVRELVKDAARRDELLGTAFWLKLAGGFCSLALVALSVFLAEGDITARWMIIVIGAAVICKSFNVIDFFFQSQVQNQYVAWSKLTALIGSSGIRIYLLLSEADLIWFAVAYTAEFFFLALGLVYFYKLRALRCRAWCFRLATAKRLLADSWPLIISSLGVSIYMKIDQVMLKDMLNEAVVGQYAAAARISEAGYFIPVIITQALFPAIIKSRRAGQEIYLSRLQQMYNFLTALAYAVILPMTLLAPWLVDFVYGAEYDAAVRVLQIHIWAFLFVTWGMAMGKWLLSENLQRYSMLAVILSAAFNVLLNYLLIPRYGANGAALATLLTYGLAGFLFYALFKKTRLIFWQLSKSIFFLKGPKV